MDVTLRHYHRRGGVPGGVGQMSLIFIFLDGVGLGLEEQSNPFFNVKTPFLTSLSKENL